MMPQDVPSRADPVELFRNTHTVMREGAGGSLEADLYSITPWGVMGWAWRPEEPDRRVEVAAVKDGKVIGQTIAADYRTDLAVTQRGDGRCGFSLEFQGVHTSAAPPSIWLGLGDVATVVEARQWSVLEGFVDEVTAWGATGWAWTPSSSNEAVMVEARSGGRLVGRAIADHMRHDICGTGRGTGLYGFVLRFDQPVSLGDYVRVTAVGPDGTRAILPSAPMAEIVGFVDHTTPQIVTGWAWRPQTSNTPLTVEAVLDDVVIGSAIADQFLSHLFDSGRGSGRFGFEMRLNRLLRPGNSPTIRALFEDRVFTLPGNTTPASDLVAQLEETAAPIAAAGGPTAVEGSVDYLSRLLATGWACLPEAPEEAVTVSAVLRNGVIGSTVANLFREDLAQWGKGTGFYGFKLVFDPHLTGEESPRFEVAGPHGTVVLPAPPLLAEAGDAGAVATAASVVEGHVDRLTRWEASGWAWIPSNAQARVEIRAVLNGKIIGSVVADELRQDLANWGKGDGLCGFHMVFNAPVSGDIAPRLLPFVPAAQALVSEAALPVASGSEIAQRPRGTIEMFVTEHAEFTGAGPEFEEFDDSILKDGVRLETTAEPWLIAFYLPQFHAIEANDQFWGKGFTEWRQLPRGISRYPGHYQPRTPRDLGFYNLLTSEALERQFAMAKAAGVTAFAYYYYWFNGTRVLEKPLDNLMASDLDVPFMIIWANENWTRTWDGSESSVLLRQDYRESDDEALVADLARHFADPRYIRINDRPFFVIYNPSNVPDAAGTIDRWRGLLRTQHGLDPLIFMTQTFGRRDPAMFGLDGAMEFPPHKLTDELPGRRTPDAYSSSFTGRVIDYEDFVMTSLSEPAQDFPLVKTAVPSWDNECRRPNRGLSLEGTSPRKYEAWLRALYIKALQRPILGQPIVAVNAWNEWAEGAYLEPDVHFGAAYLNATARARRSALRLMPESDAARPRVTVIFPNYNHEAFIVERINSVLNQTISPDEIIFLDDCSSDGSVGLAIKTLEASGIPFRIVLNSQNSGGVFRQWIKGIELARHELIWVAETDDSAHPDFLLHLIPQFEREDVAAAFGHIRYIDVDGAKLDDLEGYFDDLQNFAWNNSAVVPAYRAFTRDFTIKNVVPNASGLVFRKPRLTPAEIARLVEYRFAGDWYFYALMLRGGSIAYCRAAESYFRLNRGSASRSAFFTDRHLAEHVMVISDLREIYDVGQDAVDAHVGSLAHYLKDRSKVELEEAFASASTRDERKRPLRICIAVHSFDIGGGELMPLELANSLRGEGHHVTYLVVEKPHSGKRNLRHRLRSDVPVVYWDDIKSDFGMFLADYGIEVLNSHNVSVDYRLALANQPLGIPYVASLHGGYETVPGILTEAFYDYVGRTVTAWLFLSEKNLIPLRRNGIAEETFKRSFNAVAEFEGEWVDRAAFRAEHNIPEDAFVLIQCSRAIEEKGWGVAVDVAAEVARRTGRDVRLVLIGEGPAAERIRAAPVASTAHVTLLGQVETPIRYFRCCDAAIFPTTFSGETFPLFLLEAFMADLPVISTDIGEISHIMGSDEATRPGIIVAYQQTCDELVASMSTEIARIITDPQTFKTMAQSAHETSSRFSMSELTKRYVSQFWDVTA